MNILSFSSRDWWKQDGKVSLNDCERYVNPIFKKIFTLCTISSADCYAYIYMRYNDSDMEEYVLYMYYVLVNSFFAFFVDAQGTAPYTGP